MGNYTVKIDNHTPDPWSYCLSYECNWTNVKKSGSIRPYGDHEFKQEGLPSWIFIKYGYNHSNDTLLHNNDLECYYNGITYPVITLRSIGDGTMVHVFIKNASMFGTGDKCICPNPGALERKARSERMFEEERKRREERQRQLAEQKERERIERERQLAEQKRKAEERRQQLERERLERIRKQEEERRRRARIERERRIQIQITKDSATLNNKLKLASEKKRQNASIKGHSNQQLRSHELVQTVDDDAKQIQIDEVSLATKLLENVFLAYSIVEKIEMKIEPVELRIRKLFHHLLAEYFLRHNLPIWFHASFDEAVPLDKISLCDSVRSVDCLADVVINNSSTEVVNDLRQTVKVDNRTALIIQLTSVISSKNRLLASHLFFDMLSLFEDVSFDIKSYLAKLVFTQSWSPLEAIVFNVKTESKSQSLVAEVLHKSLTYRISPSQCLYALKQNEPNDVIMDLVDEERDKPLHVVLTEMRREGCPERVLEITEKVVRKVMAELPKYISVQLTDEMILDRTNSQAKELNFDNPDIAKFSEMLVGLCLGVKKHTTIVDGDGRIEGFFPRVTQLVSVVTLLIAKTTELNGCLLEISTGEGKSCIIAMLAVILAIKGHKVDIATSSSVLAYRDAEEWSTFYEMFRVRSSVTPPLRIDDCAREEEINMMLQLAYSANIVYGTISSFAADILKQDFEKHTIRGNRGFDAVIVDEVDYMTLDNGVQLTYLSHSTACMRHVEQILAAIWSLLCSCQAMEQKGSYEVVWTSNVQLFHKVVHQAISGGQTTDNFNEFDILAPGISMGFFDESEFSEILKIEDKIKQQPENSEELSEEKRVIYEKIMSKINPEEQHDLLLVLEKALEDTIIFEKYVSIEGTIVPWDQKDEHSEVEGNVDIAKDNVTVQSTPSSADGSSKVVIKMLLLDNGIACQVMTEKDLIDSTVGAIESRLKYSNESDVHNPDDPNETGALFMPSFLKEYVKNRLPIFVQNALRAVNMSKGREYMIFRPDNSDNSYSAHLNDCVIPVDFKASGIMQKNKRWGDGLQQFLEMKHQLAISPLSLITNYLSNFHFFKRYSANVGVFGVSGTLGDSSDTTFLEKHFKTSCYSIPTHRHKKLVEFPMIQTEDRVEWTKSVCTKIKHITEQKAWCEGQAVLLVCEDMKSADEFKQELLDTKSVIDESKITLYTRSDKHKVEGTTFRPGDVILSTNLGGRGTDINVDSEVDESGGLFVLVTYLASNRRVEKQVFGRTARKGKPGVVQMILNKRGLEEAYQGQTVDMIRQRRAEYEANRIKNMEKDELETVNIREQLFVIFCEKLQSVASHYPDYYKDLTQLTVGKTNNFLLQCQQFDYKPATNSLKETWAQWLILHDEKINEEPNLENLKGDLAKCLDERIAEIWKGESSILYDHLRQAASRMYLHEANKNIDCGTLKSWGKAKIADNAYRAVALYNEAYITINLGRDGYLNTAIDLLEQTEQSMDVYTSELANIMVTCRMSEALNRFQPHVIDETNFTVQLQIRSSLYQSWLKSLKKAIEKLKELKDNGDDAITESRGIFALGDAPGPILEGELQAFFDQGLHILYEVKKKPKFCISALICALLGALQVLAGVLVCAFSFGGASTVGLGLIAEGVSDIYSGIQGMINGTFDWAEWAISKAVSLSVSLLTAGFSVIKSGFTAATNSVKGLLNGSKSLMNIADDCIAAGKSVWSSAKTGMTSLVNASSKASVKTTFNKLASDATVKSNLKAASKYAVQELVIEGALIGVTHAIDAGLQAVFEQIFESVFQKRVSETLKSSAAMRKSLLSLIVGFGVPVSTLQSQNPKSTVIRNNNLTEINDAITGTIQNVIEDMLTDYTVINDLVNHLGAVRDDMMGLMEKSGSSESSVKAFKMSVEITKHISKYTQMLDAIPTREVLNNRVVPLFVSEIKGYTENMEYTEDGRERFPAVVSLKDKLLEKACKEVSSEFIKVCATRMTSFVTIYAKQKMNKYVKKKVGNMIGRHKTQRYFNDQEHARKMRQNATNVEVPKVVLSQQERGVVLDVAADIGNKNRPATDLDLHILTKSDILCGRTVEVHMMDIDKKELMSTIRYEGNDETAEVIKLTLVKEEIEDKRVLGFFGKVKKKVSGHHNPYKGSFNILKPDGSIQKVDSGDSNSLYTSLAKATMADGVDEDDTVTQRAQCLRDQVQSEVLLHPDKYGPMIKREKEYLEAYSEAALYTISDGHKKTRGEKNNDIRLRRSRPIGEIEDRFEDEIKREDSRCRLIQSMNEGQNEMRHEYYLGTAGLHIQMSRKFEPEDKGHHSVETDHIPTKNVLYKLRDKRIDAQDKGENVGESLVRWTEAADVDWISNKRSGEKMASINVLYEHHVSAIAAQTGQVEYKLRKLVTDCVSDDNDVDSVRLLKLSLIAAHPQSSQVIREKTGLAGSPAPGVDDDGDPDVTMDKHGTNIYYKLGFINLLSHYQDSGVIQRDDNTHLSTWVMDDGHLDEEGQEFMDMVAALKISPE